jgi:glycine cleavage system protein P-like pyridoxal-binding family
MKVEPTESNSLKQEMDEVADNLIQSAVEEEVSDEEGDELRTVKPVPPKSLSLFTMTKGSSQVLTACGAFEETNAR